jgi:c-di-GMP-binding flagellar brake protein YcgR
MTDKTDGGRKFFRIPVEDPGQVTISIGNTSYQVINVAAGGVGIYLDNVEAFATGEQIKDIKLTIDSSSCTAKGRIAHISPGDNNCLCGIELLEMDEQTSEMLKNFIDNHKASLFSFMPD